MYTYGMSISERALRYLETRKPTDVLTDAAALGGTALIALAAYGYVNRRSREKEMMEEES